jgi:predicted negative regulator of RcsB-dependent stress response
MFRLLVIIVLAFAAFWCYNNINFSNVAKDAQSSIRNEKTIKAVREKRQFAKDDAQSVMDNGYSKE